MSATRPAEILRLLEPAAAPDGELLAQFAAHRDQTAFTELVRRHGGMVLAVCQRVTRSRADAEDAFQATFLVLAKKAGAVSDAGALGGWLYGVAYRVALRSRQSADRRRAREVTMPILPDRAGPAPGTAPASDLAALLDQELAALPSHYRDAIVLCDLQGRSREDAATALGVPEGTLSSRLANGRKKLAARLTRRGVSLSVAALPGALAEVRAATVLPADLVSQTALLASDVAAGGAVPGSLANLLKGDSAVRKTLLIGATMVGMVAGAVFAARPGTEPPHKEPLKLPAVVEKAVQSPKADEQPKPAPEKAVTFTTAPKLVRATDLAMKGVDAVLWSGDGTHLAVLGMQPTTEVANGKKHRAVIALGEVHNSKLFVSFIGEGEELVGFAEDGTRFVTALREYHLISGRHELKVWTVADRPPEGLLEPLALPIGGDVRRELKLLRAVKLDATETHSYTFAPDLKYYRAIVLERNTAGELAKLVAREVDTATGKARELMTPAERGASILSFNGMRLAASNNESTHLSVYNLENGKSVSTFTFNTENDPKRPAPKPSTTSFALALSPDGRRLVTARGTSWATVIDTDTGKELPELEGAKELECQPVRNGFSADGRLMAAICHTYKATTLKITANLEQTRWDRAGQILVVWDTQTGKMLKTWKANDRTVSVAFCPTKPILAILEPNGETSTRLGFWDFSAEVGKK